MLVRHFEFEFNHAGRVFPATCDISIRNDTIEFPHRYPMYRVAVLTKLINPDVYLFYEVNQPGQRFFFYSLNDTRDLIARSIQEMLESLC